MRSLVLFGTVALNVLTGTAGAKEPAPAVAGNIPLAEIIELAKPYPNLVLQVRLQLLRANLKREQVHCTGSRFGTRWATLVGRRLSPYQCPIGKRTLVITAAQTYLDRNGRKVRADDPLVAAKAAAVKESGLTWKWK